MHGLRIIWKILATIANLATKQFVFLHPSGNAKLRALLQGTFLHRLFLCGSWTDVFSLLSCFRDDQAVCLHHVLPIFRTFNPNVYIGSTSSFVLDREHSRYRKLLQVQQNKFVLAEVALRFWNRVGNFWLWSILLLSYLSSLVCGGCSGRSLGVGPSLAGLAGAARSVLKLVMKAPI